MKHTVEVFDGDKWNVIYQTGSADTADGAWTRQAFDLTPYLSKKFGVRFGYQVLQAGGPAVGGWNVDDIVVGQRPVAGDDQFQTAPETAFLIAGSKLTSNDSDPDGDLIQSDRDRRRQRPGRDGHRGGQELPVHPAGRVPRGGHLPLHADRGVRAERPGDGPGRGRVRRPSRPPTPTRSIPTGPRPVRPGRYP